jgi:hypothetical protein
VCSNNDLETLMTNENHHQNKTIEGYCIGLELNTSKFVSCLQRYESTEKITLWSLPGVMRSLPNFRHGNECLESSTGSINEKGSKMFK